MATQQSIDHLVGLAVAMLGVAPGTDWLNARAKQLDGGATLADIANEIQSSSAFEDKYPAFLTNERFAKDFLEALLGDHVDDAVMTAAVDFVAGQLAGASRGELALALVDALTIIGGEGGSEADMAFRELHSGNFGKAAEAFHNKVMVAKHYTEEARMEDPSSSVLETVTDAADSVTAAINAIDNPPVAPPSMDGETFVLTGLRDNLNGTAQDDTFIAEPSLDPTGNAVIGDPLQPYDRIDGGEGVDTLEVYSSTRLSIRTDQVKNIEHVELNAQTSINADMSEWEGLRSVNADRFDGNVSIEVDGAMVSLGEKATGDEVVIEGAGGALEINAGDWTSIHVVSNGHTESVTTTGGSDVTVDNDDEEPSMTVKSVMVSAVNGDTEEDEDGVQTSEEPAITVRSNAIEMVDLSGTFVTALIENKSAEAADITLSLSSYGGQRVDTDGDPETPIPLTPQGGYIWLTGTGAAENVNIVANGSSRTELASDAKTLAVSGSAGLNLLSVKDSRGGGASKSLESVTVSGAAGLTLNANGNSELVSIDASGSSGRNSFSNLGSSVEKVMGGSNNDAVAIRGSLNSEGITVSLGEGDDRFDSSIGNSSKSRIDGGDGMDTLRLKDSAGSTYEDDDGEVQSIFSNFEVLDVRGGTGKFDVRQLGVQYVEVGNSTAGTEVITLENMSDGMGIAVKAGATWVWSVINDEATWGQIGVNNNSKITHDLATRESGDARHSGKLEVSLAARGASFDSTSRDATDATSFGMEVGANGAKIKGTVDLTLTAASEIEVLEVDSSVTPGGQLTSRLDPDLVPRASSYVNTIKLDGMSTAIEDVVVTGNAKLTISTANANTLASLEVLNAVANSGGVTFNATDPDGDDTDSELTQNLELLGGGGADNLTGGSGADLIYGGAGGDSLSGGTGADDSTSDAADGNFDTYDLTSVSDSQLRFTSSGIAFGFDRISDWEDGATERILLSESLYDSLEGVIKMANETANANLGVVDPASWLIDSRRTDGTGADEENVNSVKAFVDLHADGFFETSVDATAGFGTVTKHHSIALVNEFYEVITREAKAAVLDDPDTTDEDEAMEAVTEQSTEYSRTWLFIDVDGDGDFNAANDMAIALVGNNNMDNDGDTNALTETGITVVGANFVDEIPGV